MNELHGYSDVSSVHHLVKKDGQEKQEWCFEQMLECA